MSLSGQLDLSSAREDVALASTTDVASFTDTNLTDTASSFTATIDWGDGTTTSGTVVGSNGSFTVEGGHTYADEGFPTATVNVTRTADSSQLSISGTVPVADTDTINPHGATITYTPNQPLTNVTVATFTDPTNPQNPASDFVAQIDWGDGTTTSGTVQGSSGSFSVVGSHTYTAAGEFSVSVSIADDSPDAASGFVTSTAVSGFGGQVTLTSATEGTALSGAEVATFADTTGSHVAGDYTATIDWGDGTTTSGTVSGSGQSFSVTGSHTYADEEGNEVDGTSPLMTVSVRRTADSTSITATGTIVVADADFLTPISQTVEGSPNTPLATVVVAKFSDSYTGNVAGDFTTTIDWGDGSTVDTGTVSGSSGSFTVTGSHTYTANGQYNINVGVLEDIPQPAQIGAIISKAIVGLAPGDLLLTNITEGDSTSHNVATFNDGNTSDTAAAFTATIDWGDGTTTSGTITGASGSFTVSGSHAYADEGDEAPTVAVTRTADGETATITGTTTVGDADSFVVTADNFSANPGAAINNVQVATFTDTFIGQVASDLDATINWGDGTSSAGTVSGGSGSFTVTGSHTYTTGGNYTFNVSVADDPSGTATASANGTATINFSGQMLLTNTTEHVNFNGAVATFSDSNGGDTAASFSAVINWGDGTTSAGTVSGGAGTFTVSGGHTYADEGNDQASVTLTHTADQATSTVSGSVVVAEHDVLSGTGTAITGKSHQAFNNVTVATFTDTDTAAPASDFVGTIDWGDGTTTTGTVAGSSGSFTVSGTHAYATSGLDTITVTLADDAPGTATATATTIATISPGVPVKNDFNGDQVSDLLLQNAVLGNTSVMIDLMNGVAITSSATIPNFTNLQVKATGDFNHDNKADIVLQASDGTPQIWFMNGTTVASTTSLSNPGASWHIIATGDFNHDGNTDILWQDNNGTAAFWLMNGTTLIGGGAPTNPGASWHVIGAGDFNSDGNSDVLWQNDNGTPAIWEMNGATIIGGGAMTNPGVSWHAISTGDFNGDGKADILWQNDNGTPAIWLMDGTTIIGGGAMTNPGVAWHAIGTSDFNADGKSDILWQNNDGTPAIWEMDGTTIIGGGVVSNPGPTWHLKDDGPIVFDAAAASAATGAASVSTLPGSALLSSNSTNLFGDPTNLPGSGSPSSSPTSSNFFGNPTNPAGSGPPSPGPTSGNFFGIPTNLPGSGQAPAAIFHSAPDTVGGNMHLSAPDSLVADTNGLGAGNFLPKTLGQST